MIQFCKPNTPHANEQRSGVVCTPELSLSDDRERTTDTNPETSRHGFKSARTERRERGARKEEQKPLGSFQLAQKYVRTPQHFMVTLDEHPHSVCMLTFENRYAHALLTWIQAHIYFAVGTSHLLLVQEEHRTRTHQHRKKTCRTFISSLYLKEEKKERGRDKIKV